MKRDEEDWVFCQQAARQQRDGRFIVTRSDGKRFYIKSSEGELVRYQKIDGGAFIISRDDLPTTNEEVLSFVDHILGMKIARNDGTPFTEADFAEFRRLIELWYEMSAMEESTRH